MEPGKIVSVFAYQPATEVTSNRVIFETYPQQHAKKQYSFALGEQNSSHLWGDDPIWQANFFSDLSWTHQVD